MPVDVACSCGRRLRVPDRFAGTFARCPACKQKIYIPGPQDGEGEPELEVVEDDGPEEAPAKPRRPAETPPAAKDKAADKAHKRGRKKRARESKADPGQASDMAAFYASSTAGNLSYRMAEARERKENPEWEGTTIFGVHFAGGVIIGSVLVITGLLFLAILGIAAAMGTSVSSKIWTGAVIYTLTGVVLIGRSIIRDYDS
jgi:hypothetical protein